jgi:hypothetical protein
MSKIWDMFFKKEKTPEPKGEEHLIKARQRVNQKILNDNMAAIVEEIHMTFYTEVDRLLAEANIKLATDIIDGNFEKRAKALQNLGFTHNPEVERLVNLQEKQRELETLNDEKEVLTKAIHYFSQKYPNYKFITDEAVKRICTKYGLGYATVDRYTGSVPQKNLEHMINFKISQMDKARYDQYRRYRPGDEGFNTYASRDYIGKICPLYICAPEKDFKLERGESFENGRIKREILDPVVLQPVRFLYEKRGPHNFNNVHAFNGYLIVTAWGPEASDPEVVNPKHN